MFTGEAFGERIGEQRIRTRRFGCAIQRGTSYRRESETAPTYSPGHCGIAGKIVSMRAATITALAAIGAALLSAPAALADYPDCFDNAALPECGGHSWSGPGLQTWDTPGYYGGNYGGNHILCSPFAYQCRGVSPAP
jgi:hypothetical protein